MTQLTPAGSETETDADCLQPAVFSLPLHCTAPPSAEATPHSVTLAPVAARVVLPGSRVKQWSLAWGRVVDAAGARYNVVIAQGR